MITTDMPCTPAKCLNSKMDFYDNLTSKSENGGQCAQKQWLLEISILIFYIQGNALSNIFIVFVTF